jgi:translation initiation factor IF-2
MDNKPATAGARPPIVAIVGHIDHGKSTLLDYIRKSNVVAGEAGGITQHLSAYEAVHKNATGEHTITFLDTPGHEAFSKMRSRGLEVADVAILVVSSEEGAKPQTLEALKLIESVKIPYIVAFTKIDKPGSNLERAKMSMLEHNVFLEGLGGEVPFVAVSGKSGEGIPELLDLILLAAELEGISADLKAPAEGVVIEAHVDNKRGNTATLIIENGTLETGEFVVAGDAFAPTRIMENFLGKAVKTIAAGSPVGIVGFSTLPKVGAKFKTVDSKKVAEAEVAQNLQSKTVWPRLAGKEIAGERGEPRTSSNGNSGETSPGDEDRIHVILPLVIKTDVAGTADAVEHELAKLPQDSRLEVRIVSRGVGPVSEGDVKLAGSGTPAGIVIGFNVKVEGVARELAERLGVTIGVFDIIYKLTEWLGEQLAERQPREKMQEQSGQAKVLKVFSAAKGKIILGGRVESGELKMGEELTIMRRDLELGKGVVTSLQANKKEVKVVEAGNEFGAQIKTSADPMPGDTLLMFKTVYK